ncbi:3-(3-hydroxy-phenyl)propionate hydroxylase [Myxococcus hansupus]|uniref:3-(3-hydroxy-phenyl)propionate hydroxylase n=1 Tax=Pseudomyxococcus hansupus TaxID=1297742 RepID=A0A0H4X4B4_9BACT|nr:bifunctional 3-(3-hydroxy-phenyl)propionate/3-hydroxycinnamic acid hydroxylase [Myxococcus hansupus]AKQ68475.1 3-(3-hydroxy-phenyl)propionate hydroxylase [Myxococcus hansupus]
MSADVEEVDVVIVGGGPVGVLTANLLGLQGVRVLVLEREHAPHGQPRAFSCDDEALRIYQAAGLLDAMKPGLRQGRHVTFTGVGGQPIAQVRLGEVDSGFGYTPMWFFYPPLLERALREGLSRFPAAELRTGTDVEALEQDGAGVTVRYREPTTGARRAVHCRYLVACDGGRSTVRALLSVPLEEQGAQEPWIAISGTVAEEDAPSECHVVCDPERPAFLGRGPVGQFRWEFRLRTGETGEEMMQPGTIRRLIGPYVNPDRVKVERAQLYSVRSEVARHWRVGRTFLAGDAAHLMPPFLGQGLVSGLRDAANLAWKVAWVLQGRAPEALLDTYTVERRPHVRALLDATARLGSVFNARSKPMAWVRDTVLRGLQAIPSARRFVEGFPLKPAPSIEEGWVLGGRRSGRNAAEGSYLPQPRVRFASGEERLLDDSLGPGFAVLSRGCRMGSEVGRELADALGGRAITVRSAGVPGLDEDGVEDHTGRLSEWFRQNGADIAVVRPDRFVFGAVPLARLPELRTALGVEDP